MTQVGGDLHTIHNLVHGFIVDHFIYEEGGEQALKDSTMLLDEGIVDSFGMHELIMFLEEQFRIEIRDEEAIPANLGCIGALTTFIQSKFS